MATLSPFVSILFGATLLLAVWLFIKAAKYSKPLLAVLTGWILIQSALGISGFYSDIHTMTARFPLLVFPPMLLLVFQFFFAKGRAFIDGLDLRTLTILHIVRIMVEIVLFLLFKQGAIPKAMTFEGTNFDILSGISAPVVYYFAFVNKKMGKPALIAWNVLCIILLLNVVRTAVLSLPGRFVQFGFERPNVAVGYFPFLLLPACLVPMVLFSNLAAIRQLVTKKIFAV